MSDHQHRHSNIWLSTLNINVSVAVMMTKMCCCFFSTGIECSWSSCAGTRLQRLEQIKIYNLFKERILLLATFFLIE